LHSDMSDAVEKCLDGVKDKFGMKVNTTLFNLRCESIENSIS